MIVHDVTHLTLDRPKKVRGHTDFVVWHRTLWCDDSLNWVKHGVCPDARGVTRFYGLDLTSGGKPPMPPPYHLCVGPTGVVEQVWPLDLIAPHARSANKSSVGVGVIWDPTERPIPDAQMRACVELAAALVNQYPAASLVGHIDPRLPLHTTDDNNKVCPGFDVSVLEQQAHDHNEHRTEGTFVSPFYFYKEDRI
jgi:hypothetical protein